MGRLDLGIMAVLVMFTVFGAWRGFVREVFSLLTWIAAVVLAWLLAAAVGTWFAPVTADPALQQLLGFVLIFTLVFVVGAVAGFLLHRFVIKHRPFRFSNTVFGATMGLGRGALVVVIAFMLAGLSTLPQRSWWDASYLAPYFERLALFASGYLPRDVARHIRYG